MYRDLKPENLLLASNGQVTQGTVRRRRLIGVPRDKRKLLAARQLRVVDFGFAKMLPEGKAFTFCGTPDYMGEHRA